MDNKFDNADYNRIEQTIRFLEQHALEQPSLETIAEHIGLSQFHFQRLFKRWAGVSPKRFLQYLTVESAKQRLRESASVLDAALDVGLSGPGRLHDLFVQVEAVTPGEFKQQGVGLNLQYGFHPTPFGECLAAVSERGLCNLYFVEGEDRCNIVRELPFPDSRYRRIPYPASDHRSRVPPSLYHRFTFQYIRHELRRTIQTSGAGAFQGSETRGLLDEHR